MILCKKESVPDNRSDCDPDVADVKVKIEADSQTPPTSSSSTSSDSNNKTSSSTKAGSSKKEGNFFRSITQNRQLVQVVVHLDDE